MQQIQWVSNAGVTMASEHDGTPWTCFISPADWLLGVHERTLLSEAECSVKKHQKDNCEYAWAQNCQASPWETGDSCPVETPAWAGLLGVWPSKCHRSSKGRGGSTSPRCSAWRQGWAELIWQLQLPMKAWLGRQAGCLQEPTSNDGWTDRCN